jgi:creatinine amidohydrolase
VDLLPMATSADERKRASQIAVLPVGSFEQHGEFFPLITDTVVACAIAKALADRYDLFLLPPITISCSQEHAAFAGTVSIRASTLLTIICDISDALIAGGVPKLLIVNGHGGNYALGNAVQELNVGQVRAVLYPSAPHWVKARQEAGLTTNMHDDMHAGELEGSILLNATPSLVREGYRTGDHLSSTRDMLLTLGMEAYTRSGVIGRPSLATERKGADLLASLVANAADTINLLHQDR